MPVLQKEALKQMGLGFAGSVSRAIHSNYLPENGTCAGGKVEVGYFCKGKTSEPNKIYGVRGEAFTSSSERILGVVIKDKLIAGQSPLVILPDGTTAQYVIDGSAFINTTTTATKWEYVFIKDDDGSLAFDPTKTKASHTYTGWQVSIGATVTSGTQPIEIVKVD